MAGFEVVVRPVVFPNIRPAPAQSLPAATDPDQGFAVIHGSSGKSIDLPHSQSISSSATATDGNRAPRRRGAGLSEGRRRHGQQGQLSSTSKSPTKIWMKDRERTKRILLSARRRS